MDRIKRRTLLWLAGTAVVLLAVYQLSCLAKYRMGFPLDDAWIHQTFARNLARFGAWSYLPPQPSAGSTAPLWTLLLAPGQLAGINPVLWSGLLNGLLLVLIGYFLQDLWDRSVNDAHKIALPLIGLLIVSEWHLLWAALSGMETLFYILIIVLMARDLMTVTPKWFRLGLLTGLLAWVRPDGMTLLGPVFFLAVLKNADAKSRARAGLQAAAGFILLFLPYLGFNYCVEGTLLPNTYFAKQTEYAVMRNTPLPGRWVKMFFQLLVGIGLPLLPGFVYRVFKAIRERDWWGIAMILWVLGYVSLYAFRLPVVYQHARYLMPTMPLYYYLGFEGMVAILNKPDPLSITALLKKVWIVTLAVTALAFMFLGARAFADDVAIIESELVDASKWVAENTPADALVAAHDIGALGYYGKRSILDLAGLIDPEVIPFMRDEQALMRYMRANDVDYLFTFPGWYPEIVQQAQQVYSTNNPYSPAAGGENMQIFRFR